MRTLLKSKEKVQIFGIAVDKADKLLETLKKIEADNKGKPNVTLLSDADSKTIDAYGLRSEVYKGKSFYGIPKPAVIIINKKQKITWLQIEEDYKLRPKNEILRAELDKLK
jgi:peroxiredoxin